MTTPALKALADIEGRLWADGWTTDFKDELAAIRAELERCAALSAPAQPVERWYIGAMNDASFIINTPPRPSNDDIWHDRPNGPTMILRTHPLTDEEVKAIVDAHNACLAPASDRWRAVAEGLAKALEVANSHAPCPLYSDALATFAAAKEADKP